MFLIVNTISSEIELLLGNIKSKYNTDNTSLLPTITETFLKENNTKFSDIKAIAVVTGPGSFTGIRIGIAFAKGLAIGLNIPIIPINAFELYFEQYQDVFVKIDAGNGEFFVASKNIKPQIMSEKEIDKKHINNRIIENTHFDLKLANNIIEKKISLNEPVIPLYIKPSYVEKCMKN